MSRKDGVSPDELIELVDEATRQLSGEILPWDE